MEKISITEQKFQYALAEALVSDKSAFWYKVKKSSIFSTAETVGGVSGDANITAMWKNYFCSLLNSLSINSHQESANKSAIKNGNFDNIHEFLCDPGAIRSLSFKLLLNRACGNDNIFAEHIRYAHESIFFHLSVFFNACIIHGYIPKSFLATKYYCS